MGSEVAKRGAARRGSAVERETRQEGKRNRRAGFDAGPVTGGVPAGRRRCGMLVAVLALLAGLVANALLVGASQLRRPPSGVGPDAPARNAHASPGEVWRSPLGMEFAWAPAGGFAMGSPGHEETEEGRDRDEVRHEVRISRGFWLGMYEVTQGEWEAVMGENPSAFQECGSRCPVESVSWVDVREFIRRLNERESGKGYEYRLPSEAEWEYAARAGTTGARYGDLEEIAWHWDEWTGGGRVTYAGASDCWAEQPRRAEPCGTHPGGMKRANGWGLHDMLGNVWEWTADWYGEYPSGTVTDPAGPSTGSYRVIRGGGWNDGAGYVRSANRGGNSPGDRSSILGFRLARTPQLRRPPSGVGPDVPARDAHESPGEVWRSPLGMEFVWVPAGSFAMGSPGSEEGRNGDEVRHEVRISRGFWLGRYEVTQGEWEAVMGENPSRFKECGSRCPVETVSWEDVQEFIRRLNERESGKGYEYRLPSEAEWEYAARAGTSGGTPEGELRILGTNNAPVLDGQAWYRGNSGVTYAGAYDCSDWGERQYAAERCGTHPVGEKRANGWGLHDMLGNVWEWTADWYGEYPSGLVTDPAGPSTGSGRVFRGGGWYNSAGGVRSANRYGNSPGLRSSDIGFRLARTE